MHFKKRKISLRALSAILFTLTAVSGCAHVEINDSEWCGDMGNDGATCFHTLTTETRDLTKAEWDSLRFGMVCTKADTFADWKSVIEKLCNKTGICDYQTQFSLNIFFENVKAIQKSTQHQSVHP